MSKYTYKGTEYQLYTGPRGGNFIIINNKKHYVKVSETKIRKEKSSDRTHTPISNSGNKENGRSNTNAEISPTQVKWKYLSCNVPDVEHEGDIDYDLSQLRKIGKFEIVDIEREYTDDGEELTYACINFKCKPEDYDKFYKYCESNG